MKTKTNKVLLYTLMVCFVVSLLLGATFIAVMQSQAFAETTENEPTIEEIEDNFIITDTADEVLATYTFTAINDEECSVRISNKTTATKAVIPSTAEIDGKTYKVTEVAANGFASSTKVTRVSLPYSIKKVGNMAFANCTSLQRVSLANVEELGSNVFYRCTSLEKQVIPASVTTMGATVFRNANTQVLVRDAEDKDGWASNWNTGNGNMDVEYSSTYVEPLELETVYGKTARSANAQLVGYTVAGGQPRTEEFYADAEGNNIFIPNMYNGEYILGITSFAFEGSSFDQLVIEFSSQLLMIGSGAFMGVTCNNITINRHVRFVNPEDEYKSDNVFSYSQFESIVLPDSATGLADQMFAYCENLSNIYFRTPTYMEKRNDMLKIIDNYKDDETGELIDKGIVYLPQSATFTTIGESAFMGTFAISEVHIYENVQNVGANIFADLTDEQKVYVHMGQDELPTYSFNDETGWHPQWYDDLTASNVIFVPVYRTISFNPDGGTVHTLAKRVKINDEIGELPTPSYSYHNFLGWYDADGNLYTASTFYDKECNVELIARWQEYVYYVEYNANRPNFSSQPIIGAMSNSTHIYSVESPLCANAYSMRGWAFNGWNTSADGQGEQYDDSANVSCLVGQDNGTIILYAQWELEIYNIEFVNSDGIENRYANITSYTVETDTITFEEYTIDGYDIQFNAESIAKGSTDNKQIIISKTPRNYELQYDLNGATSAPINDNYYNVEQPVIFQSPSKEGYTFVGWRIIGTDTFITSTNGYTQPLQIEAVWELGETLLSSFTEVTVANDKTYLLPKTEFTASAGIKIIVPSTVNRFELKSTCNLVYTICIVISTRTDDIDIVLDNVMMRAPSGKNAIVCMSSNFTLTIYAKNDCGIYGARGADGSIGAAGRPGGFGGMGGIGEDGIVTINCAHLVLSTYAGSSLTIVGGNGGDGGQGGPGAIRGAGGPGGIGGNGASAIKGSVTINGNNMRICGGYGGDGGAGGVAAENGYGGQPSFTGGKGAAAIDGTIVNDYSQYDNVDIHAGGDGRAYSSGSIIIT